MDSVDKLKLVNDILQKEGLTQTKLAKLLDVNLTTVNNWFRRGSIPKKYLNSIGVIFDIDELKEQLPLDIFDSSINDSKKIETNIDNNTIKLQHIDDSKHKVFFIDKSLIGDKELDNIRFSRLSTNLNFVDVVDISVDTYQGDGVYYIKYPHGLLAKKIIFNFNNNSYTIKDLIDNNSILEVVNLNGRLSGKVIIRIEVFE